MRNTIKAPATKSSKRALARARLRQKLRQSRSGVHGPTTEAAVPHPASEFESDGGTVPDDAAVPYGEEGSTASNKGELILGKRYRMTDEGHDDAISISSASSESENLQDRPYDKGDSLYRGSTVSRVTKDLAQDRSSSVVTRKMTREGLAPKVDDSVLELVGTDQPRKKKGRSQGRISHASSKKLRFDDLAAIEQPSTDIVDYDSDDDPPSPGRVFGTRQDRNGSSGAHNRFIDDIAGEDAEPDDGGLASDKDSDGYESSFIAEGGGREESTFVEPIQKTRSGKPNLVDTFMRPFIKSVEKKAVMSEEDGTPAQAVNLEDHDAPSTPKKSSRTKMVPPSPLNSPFTMESPTGHKGKGRVPTSRAAPSSTSTSDQPATPKVIKSPATAKAPWPTPQTPMDAQPVSMRDLLGSATALAAKGANPSVKKGILSVDPRVHKHCVNLPDYCEVTDVESQDAFLVTDYHNLPALSRVSIVPWINTAGDGLVKFSGWGIWCPEMNGGTALNAMRFVATLARRPKQISVAFHTQEWDRYLAFAGMATGKKTMWAQYREDALQFTTRPVPDTSQRRGSASSASVLATPSTPDAFALSHSDIIPVYDAREARTIDFDKDLRDLDSFLPRWQGEIPYGSFVVVGHTIVVYYSKHKRWTLACNLQWVIVVGVPPESNTKSHLAYVRTDVVEEEQEGME
ncbi:hypothetical protein MD484_g8353, partial [Candolleomyces efflorescens]